MTATAWTAAFLFAFAVSGALARSGPVDAPRDRGAHRTPTPTTGGMGIVAACCLGAALAGAADGPLTRALACAGALGAYAAADDLFDLGAALKLLAQAIASITFAAGVAAVSVLPLGPETSLSLPLWIGVLGTAFWFVLFGNVVNFMDGADGLVAGAVAIAAAGTAAVALVAREPEIAAGAAALAAANVGFLPWNMGRKLFQGDVGALFSSFALAALGVLLAIRGAASPYLVPLAALPLLVDGLGTLLLRVVRREKVWRPHKQHLYHLWLAAGRGDHLALATRVWLLSALCTSAAVAAELQARAWAPVVFLGLLLTLGGGWFVARRGLAAR